MFVTSNEFSAVRRYFSENLSELYSHSELKIILKYLFLKRFDGTSSDYLLADDKRLSESDILFFHDALKRLLGNEPFQHVIGEAEFYGLLLKCDRRALIPRPETEELVDWILNNHPGTNNDSNVPMTVVDICSGSGCIALALKSNLPEAKVSALEYSDEAIGLIQENASFTGLGLRIINADALSSSYGDLITEPVDVIVSNPPYIPNLEKQIMAANVLDFEPEMALFVEDDDPLLFYREIMERSKAVLGEGGWLYFEIHEDLGKEVKLLFEQSDFVNIELRKDLQGKDRMMRGQVVTSGHECQ